MQGDGATLRDHLLSVEKQTRQDQEMLHAEPCPKVVEYLWQWFLELSATRGNNGTGSQPISYLEIGAWSDVTGNNLTAFESRVIRLLDNLVMSKKGEK